MKSNESLIKALEEIREICRLRIYDPGIALNGFSEIIDLISKALSQCEQPEVNEGVEKADGKNPYGKLVSFINRHGIEPTQEQKLREIINEISDWKQSSLEEENKRLLAFKALEPYLEVRGDMDDEQWQQYEKLRNEYFALTRLNP